MATATLPKNVERELTTSQRRAYAAGDSVEITGNPALLENCSYCLDFYTYWLDPEGIWAKCACDGGYLR